MKHAVVAPHAHSRLRALTAIVFLLAVLAGLSAAFPRVCHAAEIAVKLAPGTRFVTTANGGLAVVRDWASLTSRPQVEGALALRSTGRMDDLGIELLRYSPGCLLTDEPAELTAVLSELRLVPGVLWAEVGSPLHACLVPDDPWYPPVGTSVGQWGLARARLLDAWDVTPGSAAVTVAFLDTGINRDIRDFAGRLVAPYSVLNHSTAWPDWQDNDGHGSAVTAVGVAQGNDEWGIAGAAWNVGVMPVKISDDGNSDTITLAAAIEYAVDKGADVINVSFATPPGTGPGETLRDAIEYALKKGVAIVAAAGNDGGLVSYPAAIDGVIAVGATTSEDVRWTKSEHGSNTGAGLDMVAPGSHILSYYPGSSSLFSDGWSGTSLSCPLVAGVVALMLSVDSSLTPAEISDILASSAEDLGTSGWDAEFGFGIVDAQAAVARAASSIPPTTTSTTTSTASTSTTTTTVPPTSTTTTSSTTTTTTAGRQFSDVNEQSTPYSTQIDFLAARGIVGGTGGGLFHPQQPLTRQQFAKMMVLALGYPVSEADVCPFVDVPRVQGELYPYQYVAVAYKQGITTGTTSTHFSPYRTLTRAQLITMVARAAKLPEPPSGYSASFPNFSAVHYAYARKAEYAGLLADLAGMGYRYDFSAPATRGEVCALLYALLR
jgi:subtilisin family serine protease